VQNLTQLGTCKCHRYKVKHEVDNGKQCIKLFNFEFNCSTKFDTLCIKAANLSMNIGLQLSPGTLSRLALENEQKQVDCNSQVVPPLTFVGYDISNNKLQRFDDDIITKLKCLSEKVDENFSVKPTNGTITVSNLTFLQYNNVLSLVYLV